MIVCVWLFTLIYDIPEKGKLIAGEGSLIYLLGPVKLILTVNAEHVGEFMNLLHRDQKCVFGGLLGPHYVNITFTHNPSITATHRDHMYIRL